MVWVGGNVVITPHINHEDAHTVRRYTVRDDDRSNLRELLPQMLGKAS
jgi:hypothetical protein